MSWLNTPHKYGKLNIALHWLMLLVMIGVYACIELRELYPRGSDPRNALKVWHFMLGISILLLVLARIGIRFAGPTPAINPKPPAWQSHLAKLMHLLLYALMLGMPVAGWLILNGEGHAVPFFGLDLPVLIGENKDLAHDIEEIHESVGELGYYLIGLHAISGLAHHYLFKDNTLLRMLPGKSTR